MGLEFLVDGCVGVGMMAAIQLVNLLIDCIAPPQPDKP